jgi:CRISPR/Cas system CSM-associated protein Csm4 (group 5 of RAMP superfamily)
VIPTKQNEKKTKQNNKKKKEKKKEQTNNKKQQYFSPESFGFMVFVEPVSTFFLYSSSCVSQIIDLKE